MPHSYCYLGDPKIIWLHVATDALIGGAYVAISCILGYLVLKESSQIPFHWMFLAFGAFIIFCGFTHFMDIWTVWYSVYWLSGYIKAITAVASVITAVALFRLIPKILRLIESVRISEERRIELRKAHAALKDSYSEMEKQKRDLEIANKDLEMFAYSAAHDMRAPLRSLQGFSNILKSEHGAGMEPEAQELVGRIHRSARKLESFLDDMLEYSKVSRMELSLKSIPLQDVLGDAVEAAENQEREPKPIIKVQGEVNSMVFANETLLMQILSNLLSNAIKFVPNGTRPEVMVEVEDRKDWIRIKVRDNGIGIAEAYQEKIFGLFERLHSSDEYPGTGIGLAIVHRAAMRMGGKVGLDSIAKQGSTFWIDLAKPNQRKE